MRNQFEHVITESPTVVHTRYEFDPHRHIKIWLSNDPSIFMNPENQLRLLQMRAACPGDAIRLVYDSHLLSEQAQPELFKFCSKNKIEALNVRDIMHECLADPQESALLRIYEDEITHLDAGGNLAAASDILRWLKPICRLGIYTDLDVHVTTKELDPVIEVFGDVIIPCGTYKLFGDEECLVANNNAILVANIDSEKIKSIQKYILTACQPKKIQQYILDAFQNNAFCPRLNPDPTMYLTPREFRAQISSMVRKPFSRQILDNPALMKRIAAVEKRLYMQSVIRTTGPSAVMSLFCSFYNYSARNIDAYVAPFSFAFYPMLNDALKATQRCFLHASNQKKAVEYNVNGDLSWLAIGQDEIRHREEQLHLSARIIQKKMKQVLNSRIAKGELAEGHINKKIRVIGGC